MPRGRKTLSNKIKKQKPTARNQQKQLISLSKKVTKLAKRDVNFAQFIQKVTSTSYNSNGGNVTQFLLTQPPLGPAPNPSPWVPIFQGVNAQTPDVTVKEYHIEMQFKLPGGALTTAIPVSVTNIFLVQPRKGAMDLFDGSSDGALNLVADTHYAVVNSGNVVLNPAMFKIIRQKRLIMGGETTSTQDVSVLGDIIKRFAWKVRRNDRIVSPNNNWQLMDNDDVDITKRLYLLLFTDDTANDADVNVIFNYNCLVKSMYF